MRSQESAPVCKRRAVQSWDFWPPRGVLIDPNKNHRIDRPLPTSTYLSVALTSVRPFRARPGPACLQGPPNGDVMSKEGKTRIEPLTLTAKPFGVSRSPRLPILLRYPPTEHRKDRNLAEE